MIEFQKNFLKVFSYRKKEFAIAFKYLSGCNRILDVGCGQGRFIALAPERVEGVDINQESVDLCKNKGFNVQHGNALELPYDKNEFDGLHCSHVIQIFDWQNALKMLHEFRRVVKPGGIIVITTFPDHKRLFFTPETFRAYPPQALRALTKQREDTYSDPTSSNHPLFFQKYIWFRRPPLIEFTGPRSNLQSQLAVGINLIQYKFFLRKYWTFNGYVISFINGPK